MAEEYEEEGPSSASWGNENASQFSGMPGWWTERMKRWMDAPGSTYSKPMNDMFSSFDQYFSGQPKYQPQTNSMLDALFGKATKGATPGQPSGALGNYMNDYMPMVEQFGLDFSKLLGGQGGAFGDATEKARQAMQDQFMTGMTKAKRDLFQPTLDNMSARGILNSDVTGNALAREDMNLQDLLAQNLAGANTWAATQGQDYLKTQQGKEQENMLRTQGLSLDYTKSMPSLIQGILSSLGSLQSGWNETGKAAVSSSGSMQELIQKAEELMKYSQGQSTREWGSESAD